MSGAPNLTSNPMTVAQYCDFGRRGVSCWKRCKLPNGRWDGAPTNLWREVWRILRRKPLQLELV